MESFSSLINYIALVYICLPLAFLLFIAVYYLIGKSISSGKWTSIIEFGKWYMASVAVVFIGKMVEASFTERETGIKEIAVFEKYTNIIMKADSVDLAWGLARYFSIVTPTERLRDRWRNLRDTLQVSYVEIQMLRRKKDSLLLASIPEQDKSDSIAVVDNTIAAIRRTAVLSVSMERVNEANPGLHKAREFESKGFQALLAKKIDEAISGFHNAEESLNGYHMVYELERYLRSYRKQHKDDIDWKEIYTSVLGICTRYKGTIPEDVKIEMEKRIE